MVYGNVPVPQSACARPCGVLIAALWLVSDGYIVSLQRSGARQEAVATSALPD